MSLMVQTKQLQKCYDIVSALCGLLDKADVKNIGGRFSFSFGLVLLNSHEF